MSSSPDWTSATAHSLDDLERLAIAAWERLPVDVRRTCGDPPREADMVFLYRRAIFDHWAETGEETLANLVTHVLVHKIGHHFGFSDADMEAIEAATTP